MLVSLHQPCRGSNLTNRVEKPPPEDDSIDGRNDTERPTPQEATLGASVRNLSTEKLSCGQLS